MKNSQPLAGRGKLRLLFKMVAIMKLSILFILLGILQARAGAHAQGSITLNVEQVEIGKILNKIQKEGEFRFLYNYDLVSLKKKVSVHLQNSDIKGALTKIFDNTRSHL